MNFKFSRQIIIGMCAGFLFMLGSSAQSQDYSDVPLPDDMVIVAPGSDVSPTEAQFSGIWAGSWNTTTGLHHILVVERIESPDVTVIYSSAAMGAQQSKWARLGGKIEGRVLETSSPWGGKVTYTLQDDGTVKATFRKGTWNLRAKLKKLEN